jgi:hypothetical protein
LLVRVLLQWCIGVEMRIADGMLLHGIKLMEKYSAATADEAA